VIARKPLFLIVFFIFSFSLSASEVRDGFLRLILNERNGSFLLYFLTNPSAARYEPLFNTTATSFLALNVDGQSHRLGESRTFNTSYERLEGNPALVFESSTLKISEIFSPVKTANSPVVNGVKITIIIENKNLQRTSIGLRLLIDTQLGEGRGKVPFITNSQVVTRETKIEGNSGEKFWISRGETVSLMGSILDPFNSSMPPDFIHIANWKRLNDVPWKLRYYEGRSFNYIPYSIEDSAVCYYYEPGALQRGETLTYSIYLTTEDTAWYNSAIVTSELEPEPEAARELQIEVVRVTIEGAPPIDFNALKEAAAADAARRYEDADMLLLISLQNLLDQFIAGQINLNEQDLAEIERSINQLKNKI